MTPESLEEYAGVHQKGAALYFCWGFIDGTVGPVCRPGQNQRVLYNGHKRVHSIKFQSVVTPNGLIANLFGAIEGKRHDSAMLAESGLLNMSFNNIPILHMTDSCVSMEIQLTP